MSKGNWLRATAATVGVVIGGVLLASAPALAATSATPHATASGGTAPACIERSVSNADGYATLTNLCGKTMTVKVIINNGPDSDCFSIPNNRSRTFYYLIGGYDRTVVC
jgi:hypothetical protein